MKIISYNVNGIRAAMKKGLTEWLQQASPDVLLVQETKAMREQVDLEALDEAGYPYHYWHSAEKKGYSGVAVISKHEPRHVEYGTGIDYMDKEGRNLRLDFDGLSELMADLKTIDAQLGSSQPKTAIIRECLRSIRGVLEGVGSSDGLAKIRTLLGE